MNLQTKCCLYFLSGGIIGSVITAIAIKDIYAKKADAANLSFVREYKKQKSYEEKIAPDISNESEDDAVIADYCANALLAMKTASLEYENLAAMKRYSAGLPDQDEPATERDTSQPYEITEEDIMNKLRSDSAWDNVSYTFYDIDQALADDHQLIDYDEAFDMCGIVTANCFHNGHYYVRNEKYRTDYELTFHPGGFGDSIDEDEGDA